MAITKQSKLQRKLTRFRVKYLCVRLPGWGLGRAHDLQPDGDAAVVALAAVVELVVGVVALAVAVVAQVVGVWVAEAPLAGTEVELKPIRENFFCCN